MKQEVESVWVYAEGKGPKWKREACVTKDGDVFVPAALWGDEMHVMLAATNERAPMVLNKEHVYVSIDWLRREYPEHGELLDRMETHLLEAAQ